MYDWLTAQMARLGYETDKSIPKSEKWLNECYRIARKQIVSEYFKYDLATEAYIMNIVFNCAGTW